jgi:hypothetical protein
VEVRAEVPPEAGTPLLLAMYSATAGADQKESDQAAGSAERAGLGSEYREARPEALSAARRRFRKPVADAAGPIEELEEEQHRAALRVLPVAPLPQAHAWLPGACAMARQKDPAQLPPFPFQSMQSVLEIR